LVDLLGPSLESKSGAVQTMEALAGKGAVALYFSAHWCPPCRGFTPELADWYKKSLQAKGLEIVFVSADKDAEQFNEYLAEMPWLAVPYVDRARERALSKRFKVQGIPSLVILGPDGKVITKDGRAAVSSDPIGENFPWVPKSLDETMAGATLLRKGGERVSTDVLKGKTYALYFSAYWCPPCLGFTPKLAEWYSKSLQAKGLEIVFVSSDREEDAFQNYFGEMPWLALPYEDRDGKEALSKVFGVNGIPSFHIIEHDGTVINNGGRGAVGGDPEGAEFPWHPKPVNDLAAGPEGINETPSVIVLMEKVPAAEQDAVNTALTNVATNVLGTAKAEGKEPPFCFFTGKSAGGITDRVRELVKGGAAGDKPQLVLLDIPDNGGYYSSPADEVTEATIDAFLSGYQAKALDRQQLS